MFVMGGSIVLGLVVFCVLLIVNFVVITKGAARMAEVGARFALDAMPGKQLAIDSDMAAGAIDHAEAKARRERDQAETTFFGSLDGASKFVKGDAIAGLLITLLNLVMGLIIGLTIHDMPLGLAFETYAILTVGDGLVSQIPPSSSRSRRRCCLPEAGRRARPTGGLLPARALSGRARHGRASARSSSRSCRVCHAAVPSRRTRCSASAYPAPRARTDAASVTSSKTEALPPQRSMGDILELDEIHVEFAPDLVPMVLDPATGLEARIANMRQHVATVFG
jgi:flagellar biosynthesis protein FlhA